MQHAKNPANPLAILSRILAQSCVTLCLNYVYYRDKLCMIVLVSLIECTGPTSRAIGHLLKMTKSQFCRFPNLTLTGHSNNTGILYG